MTCPEKPFHEISHDNNMAVVRYILSLVVLVAHTSALAGVDLPLRSYSFVAVGGFFALSGFLLFGSFQRRPELKYYLQRRARRILPPYFLVVIAAAVGLSAVSSLTPEQYFTDSGFWEYLGANLSFLNFLHPELPGVFATGEFYNHAVNGSLWTMKGEWMCYLCIPPLFWLIQRRRLNAAGLMAVLIALCMAIKLLLWWGGEQTGRQLFFTIEKQLGTIFIFFFCGALINLLYTQFLKYKWAILAAMAAAGIAGIFFEELYYLVLRPLVIATLVIWVSQVGHWGRFLRGHEDLSYDIYLFHYPIIQLFVYLGLPSAMSPAMLLLAVTAATTLCAWLSWNCVGRRLLKRPVRHQEPAGKRR